jgi:hypothetical protein
MKNDTILPNKEIFAVCKEDIRGAFESFFMAGCYYKGKRCQMDICIFQLKSIPAFQLTKHTT